MKNKKNSSQDIKNEHEQHYHFQPNKIDIPAWEKWIAEEEKSEALKWAQETLPVNPNQLKINYNGK